MANKDAAFGLRIYQPSTHYPRIRKYYVPVGNGDNLFIGDPVKLTGDTDATGKFNAIEQADAGDTCCGFIVAHCLSPTNLNRVYLPSSTEGYVMVCDDPNVEMIIQANAAFTSAYGGRNANLVSGTGNTSTGTSGYELNISTVNTTATLDLRIHNILDREDNEIGADAIVVVSWNVHQFKVDTGSTGI